MSRINSPDLLSECVNGGRKHTPSQLVKGRRRLIRFFMSNWRTGNVPFVY